MNYHSFLFNTTPFETQANPAANASNKLVESRA
jgi:hypothetical protein